MLVLPVRSAGTGSSCAAAGALRKLPEDRRHVLSVEPTAAHASAGSHGPFIAPYLRIRGGSEKFSWR